MVKLRFRRMGRRKHPVFALVAADSRSPRDGRYIEDLGRFYPVSSTDELTLNRERVLYWLQEGAQPSDSVRSLLRKEGVMLELHLLRKGVDAEAIATQVETHRTRWAQKAADAQTVLPEERRKKALEAERQAAEEERKRLAAERQEREAELEKQRKEAEEAERAAAAEAERARTAEAPTGEMATSEERVEGAAPEAVEVGEQAPQAEAAVPDDVEPGAPEVVGESSDEPESEAVEAKSAGREEGEGPVPPVEAKSKDESAEMEAEAAAQETEKEERAVEAAAEAEPEEQDEPGEEATREEPVEAPAAEKEEPTPELAVEAEPDDTTPDKLTEVWGIGPKYASILNGAGIQTFAALAGRSVEDLQKIITDAGSTTAGNEETWAEQAAFLAKGDVEGHNALVETLKAG